MIQRGFADQQREHAVICNQLQLELFQTVGIGLRLGRSRETHVGGEGNRHLRFYHITRVQAEKVLRYKQLTGYAMH